MEKLGSADPQRIGAYRLLGRLGAGGMGQVYLARSDRGRTVALKLVREELAVRQEFRDRFRQEVRAARRVGSTWTAPVLDADTEADVPWVATGYVAGPSLHATVTGHASASAEAAPGAYGPLPERSVRILGAGLAHALKAIHTAGLIHRDLKPSNILLTIDGPRVIDFGIARALDTVADSGLTRTGALIGSPGFMAPEQVRGERVTAACDVFCLGAVLAYASTGRLPFGAAANEVHALLFRIAQEDPDLSGVPTGLVDLVRTCLHKEPAARPTTDDILALLDRGDSAEPWLPGALLAQLGRHAVELLDSEDPEDAPPPAEPQDAVPSDAVPEDAVPSDAPQDAVPGGAAPGAPVPNAEAAAPTTPLVPLKKPAPALPAPGPTVVGPPPAVAASPATPPPATPPPATPAPATPPPAAPTPTAPAPGYGYPQQPAQPYPVQGYGYPQQQNTAPGYGHPQQQNTAPGYGYPQQPGPNAGYPSGYSQQPGANQGGPYGYPQPGFGPTPPYGPVPPGGAPQPAPAPARRSTGSTVALVVIAVLVAIGAGGSVYALMNEHGGKPTASPTRSSGPSPSDDASDSPSPDGSQDPSPSDDAQNGDEKGAIPKDYLGTWSGSIDNANGHSTRELVIRQGQVGDPVLTLTAEGPLATGGTYRCVFEADLATEPSDGGPVSLGPSSVTLGEPMASCTPGSSTLLTLLPDGTLSRENTTTGEKLTYTKSG
ncbi:serine/threonine-protein kinase [Streptomyces sp. ITFR-16]|uniref:serine/threonine-protein kinase n=1 Tax=Streptomyces sp. ITFR-16 TaxID=3075198 RepID=UPI00288AEEA6|nr:serine/threonine-protein kinase [Streptomyces sp. ITFR-16]WNI23920.1 serine/threonine-protein kinase [Streptomyces sp. ITFR-16]